MKKSSILFSTTLSLLLFVGCGGGSSTPTQKKVTVAQALLGPLSGAKFKITTLDGKRVIAEGITTEGSKTDVNSAGLIQIPQDVKDALTKDLYIVEVTGGKDIDSNDDNVWDANPIDNRGSLHLVTSGTVLQKGSYKINILTEIVFESIKDRFETDTKMQLHKLIAQKANTLLKSADNDGDVNGDGKIDGWDLIAWSPAKDKSKLKVDYNSDLKPIVDFIHDKQDISNFIDNLF